MSANLVKVDLSRFNKTLKALVKGVPVEAEKVLRNEAKLLVEDLIKKSVPKDVNNTKKQIKKSVQHVFAASPRGTTTLDFRFYRQNRRKKLKTRVLAQAQTLKAFTKEQIKHIGFLAAGWLGNKNPLKARAKQFVVKHDAAGVSKIVKGLLGMKISVFNHVLYAQNVKGFIAAVQRSVNSRTAKMGANLKRIRSGAAKYRS